MKNFMKIMIIFAIVLISFTTFVNATNNSETQNILQVKERILSAEKKASVLERIMSRINSTIQTQNQTSITNQVPVDIKQLQVRSVQRNEIHTMNDIKLIPASKQVTLKIENGKAYAVKANITHEMKAEPRTLIYEKISSAELTTATNFRVETDIQNNELEYNVKYEVPNPIPVINWIFPVLNKEVKISAEEIKQADIKITKTMASKATANALSATPAPVQYTQK